MFVTACVRWFLGEKRRHDCWRLLVSGITRFNWSAVTLLWSDGDFINLRVFNYFFPAKSLIMDEQTLRCPSSTVKYSTWRSLRARKLIRAKVLNAIETALRDRAWMALQWEFGWVVCAGEGGEGLPASSDGWAEVVSDIRLHEQLLKDLYYVWVIFCRALDEAALPVELHNRLDDFFRDCSLVVRQIHFVANNHDRHSRSSLLDDLREGREGITIVIS